MKIKKIQSGLFVVSKIKKIKVKGCVSPKYLVKWYKSINETWEPSINFPNKIESYPGYKESITNLFRVRSKSEKIAVEIMINCFR
jgi:hypothetical protein